MQPEVAQSEVEAELARLRRRNAELELLFETTRDLASTLSVREVLERLLSRALAHLDAEMGSIQVIDAEGRLAIEAAQGLPEAIVTGATIAVGEGIAGHVAETGEPLLVADIESDPRFERENRERYYTASCISAPLLHRGAVRGVVNVNNKRSRAAFTQEDLRLLEALAGHASAALANAHRYEEVLERAQRDALTGLANHGHFWSVLAIEFARAERHGRTLGLALIDVDHFKAYNDRLGHPAGDEALARVARILDAETRAHDLAARYGGEEFAVILPETDLGGALRFAEKIRRAVESACFGPGGGESLTVSIGIATSAGEIASPRELVGVADERLYEAKRAGRNQVSTGDPSLA